MRKDPKERHSGDVALCRDGRRLESWKAIANYLSRTVRTVQRWEKHEGLPVHRHLHGRQGTVYAYAEELDAWRSERAALAAVRRRLPVTRAAAGLAAIAAAVVVSLGFWLSMSRPGHDSPVAGDPTRVDGAATSPQTMAATDWTNREARQLFMVGREHLGRRNFESAIEAFERAGELDPESTRPLGAIALVRALQSGWIMERVGYAHARKAAEDALGIDATLAEAHAALGIVALEERRIGEAEASLRTALELDPELAEARYWLTVVLEEQGLYAESDRELEAALAMDPLHPQINGALATRYTARGEYDRARQRQMAILGIGNPSADLTLSLSDLNREFGRFDEAIQWARQTALRKPVFTGLNALILTYTRLEMYPEAERWLEHMSIAETPGNPRQGTHCTYLYMRQRVEECYALKEEYLERSGVQLDELPFALQETFGGMAVLVGRYEEGIEILETLFRPELRVPEHLGGSEMAVMFAQTLAWAYQQTGREPEAEALLADIGDYLSTLRSRNRGVRPAMLIAEARNDTLLGRQDLALASLRAAVEAGWRDYVYERPNPAWDSLRRSPEYKELLGVVMADVAEQRGRIRESEPDGQFEPTVLELIEKTVSANEAATATRL